MTEEIAIISDMHYKGWQAASKQSPHGELHITYNGEGIIAQHCRFNSQYN
jgi:hypothetical protein